MKYLLSLALFLAPITAYCKDETYWFEDFQYNRATVWFDEGKIYIQTTDFLIYSDKYDISWTKFE